MLNIMEKYCLRTGLLVIIINFCLHDRDLWSRSKKYYFTTMIFGHENPFLHSWPWSLVTKQEILVHDHDLRPRTSIFYFVTVISGHEARNITSRPWCSVTNINFWLRDRDLWSRVTNKEILTPDCDLWS